MGAVDAVRRAIPRMPCALCLAALLATAHTLAAKGAVKYWASALTGGATEGAFSVQETLYGGAIVAGWRSSPDEHDDRPQTMLARLDARGGAKWQETLTAPSYGDYEYLYSARQTSDGGFIVVGRVQPDGAGVAVLKLNRAGQIIWKTYLGGDGAWAHDVALATDGGYVVFATMIAVDFQSDLYLIKLDSEGAVEWQKRYGLRSQDEWASTLVQTSDGGYLMTAFSYLWYPLLVRLDSSGSILWSKFIRVHVWMDDVIGACETEDGGFLVSFNDFSAHRDIYLMRLDPSGEAVWQRKFDGGTPDWVRQVIRTRDGNYIAAGITKQKGSYSDALLLKIDPSGNIIWQRTYGSPIGPESGNSVCEAKDGGLLMAGNSCSFGNGDSDIWVLRLDEEGLLGGSSCEIINTAALQPFTTKLKVKGYKASVFGVNSIPGTLEWTVTPTELKAVHPCSSAMEIPREGRRRP